jgi:undecaprenyl-diphosphatase
LFSNTAEQAATGEHKKMPSRVSPYPFGEPKTLFSALARQFAKGVKRERDERSPLTPESTVLLEAFLVAACIWTFVKLAGKIRKGGTDAIDNEILRALRRPENPAIPRGPSWLPEVARDVTALGSGVDLTLASTTLVGYLCLNRRFRAAGYLIASVGSGLMLCRLLKDLFVRRRPTAVAHLTHFDPESFPSGHSMGSAIVYLTLGGIISRQFGGWITKAYFLSVALLITLLVGLRGSISAFIIRAMCWRAGRPGLSGQAPARRPRVGSSAKALLNFQPRLHFLWKSSESPAIPGWDE